MMDLGMAIVWMNFMVGLLTLGGAIYLFRIKDKSMAYLLLIISGANFYLGWQFFLGL